MGCGAGAKSVNRPWIEARSHHFTVRTELDQNSARATTSELEKYYAAFEQVAYPHQPKPTFRFDVVVLDEKKELEDLGYARPDGVLLNRRDASLEEHLTMVVYGALDDTASDSTRTLFLHELAHRFTTFYFPSAPVWLQEGLSVLFETLEIEGDEVVVGRAPSDKIFANQPWRITQQPHQAPILRDSRGRGADRRRAQNHELRAFLRQTTSLTIQKASKP